MKNIISCAIRDSIGLKEKILKDKKIISGIGDVSEKAVRILKSGGRLFFFGNGGSASDAQHLSTELVVRFKRERKALAAICLSSGTALLTAQSNDYCFDDIFSRQIEALVQKGDFIFAISTSGVSPNIVKGLKTARKKGAYAFALLGKGGGQAKKYADSCIIVPSDDTARIQEAQIMLGHIFCDLVESAFC